MLGDPALLIHAEETLVANQVIDEEQVVAGDDDINRVKTKIFNKIIPQSREAHIIKMTGKRNMIKDDIRYLKQSIQDLAAEQIGRRDWCQTRPRNRTYFYHASCTWSFSWKDFLEWPELSLKTKIICQMTNFN